MTSGVVDDPKTCSTIHLEYSSSIRLELFFCILYLKGFSSSLIVIIEVNFVRQINIPPSMDEL